MSSTIGTVIIDVKADTAKLVSGMEKAQKTVKKSVDNIKTTLVSMAVAYAGFQGINAFSDMVSDSIDAADAAGKLAKKLGLTTNAITEYQYAASMAGVSNGELNAGLSALIRRLNNFQENGGGAAADAFESLGISAKYARDNFTSTDIAFVEILKRLEEMPDGYKKTAVAQDIFSKSASGMLNLTATDLKNLGEESRRIGLSISQSTSDMAVSYNDEMDQLDARMRGIKQTVAFSVIAPMNAASKTVVEMYDDMFGSSVEKMQYFEDAAVTVIGNVAYSVGFIKDALTGIELVIKSLELVFYGLATGVSSMMEPLVRELNTMIGAYNYIADTLGKKPLNIKIQSSLPDNIQKVKELANEIKELSYSLEDGRITSDEYMKKFKSNLIEIKDKAGESNNSKKNSSSSTSHIEDSSSDKEFENEWKDWIETEELKDAETQRLYSEKMQLEEDWKSLIEENNSSMLDSQIELTSSTYDWQNGLDGVASSIGGVGEAFSKMAVDNLKATKAQNKLDLKFKKDMKKYEKDEKKTQKITEKYNKDSAKIKELNFKNELDAYGNLAGASAAFFDQNSTGYKVLTGIQLGLQFAIQATALAEDIAAMQSVTNSAAVSSANMTEAATGATKSVASAGGGDPYTAAARVVAMMALMASAMTMFGGSGGGGSAAPAVSQPSRQDVADSNIEGIESRFEPITDRLDRQISLLESIDLAGSAGRANIELASTTFSKDYQIATEQALVDMNTSIVHYSAKEMDANYKADLARWENAEEVTWSWGIPTYEPTAVDKDSEAYQLGLLMDSINEKFNDNLLDTSYNFWLGDSDTVNQDLLRQDTNMLLLLASIQEQQTYTENNSATYSPYWAWWDTDESFFDSVAEYDAAVNEMQEVVGDYATSMIDVVKEMSDAAEQFRGIYDDITGTTYYADAELSKAFSDFDKLRGSDSYSEYLKGQIDAISAVEDSLDMSITNLLLSTNPDDLMAQYEAIEALNKATGVSFDNGVEDALNFLDSIELVGEALGASTENMKSWNDSFKTDIELAQDLANNKSVELATNFEELSVLFDLLSNDTEGLADSDLELLEANRDLIDAQAEVIDDLYSFADDLLAVSLDSTSGFDNTMALLNESILGFSTSDDQSISADSIMNYANDAVDFINKSSTSAADRNYETAMISNKIKDLAIENDVGSLKSVEDRIVEMKDAIVAELSDIKDNTEREYAA